MARAINSLPVPVSPRTSTVESVGATRSTSASTHSRAVLLPMICSNLRSPCPSSLDDNLLTPPTAHPTEAPRNNTRSSTIQCCSYAVEQLFLVEGFSQKLDCSCP